NRMFAGSWAVVVGLACCRSVAVAGPEENWPQWRGPLQSGVAPLANPVTLWSETNNVRWKWKIPGEGSATPLILDNLLFVQTAIPSGKKPEDTSGEAKEQNSGSRSDSAVAPNSSGPGGGPGEPGRGPGGRGGRFGGGQKPTETYDFAILCLERSSGKILW